VNRSVPDWQNGRNGCEKEAAQAIGHTTHSHVSELETGKRRPSLDLALRLARFFDVSLDQLVKDELELE